MPVCLVAIYPLIVLNSYHMRKFIKKIATALGVPLMILAMILVSVLFEPSVFGKTFVNVVSSVVLTLLGITALGLVVYLLFFDK